MKLDFLVIPALAVATFFVGAASVTAESKKADESKEQTTVVFVPPASGVPADRVGAGTRDLEVSGKRVRVIAPDGGGLSSESRPLVVWELTEPFDGIMQAEVTLLEEGVRVAGTAQNARFRPGLYGLDMARGDRDLEPGRIHAITIYLADGKTREVVERATSLIERSGPRLGNAAEAASAGIWFDALGYLTDIDFSGRVRVQDVSGFTQLLQSAGL